MKQPPGYHALSAQAKLNQTTSSMIGLSMQRSAGCKETDSLGRVELPTQPSGSLPARQLVSQPTQPCHSMPVRSDGNSQAPPPSHDRSFRVAAENEVRLRFLCGGNVRGVKAKHIIWAWFVAFVPSRVLHSSASAIGGKTDRVKQRGHTRFSLRMVAELCQSHCRDKGADVLDSIFSEALIRHEACKKRCRTDTL